MRCGHCLDQIHGIGLDSGFDSPCHEALRRSTVSCKGRRRPPPAQCRGPRVQVDHECLSFSPFSKSKHAVVGVALDAPVIGELVLSRADQRRRGSFGRRSRAAIVPCAATATYVGPRLVGPSIAARTRKASAAGSDVVDAQARTRPAGRAARRGPRAGVLALVAGSRARRGRPRPAARRGTDLRLAPTRSGQPSAVERVEMPQELPVVGWPRLAKPEPRAQEHDRLAGDAGRLSAWRRARASELAGARPPTTPPGCVGEVAKPSMWSLWARQCMAT